MCGWTMKLIKRAVIKPAQIIDIDVVFKLYDEATDYQKTKFDKTWNGFERSLIEREINESRLFKILEAGTVACVFSIAFSDAMIWGEKDRDSSVYLHRIATNPAFRGKGYVLKIIKWAKKYAYENEINFVRLDTFGDNQRLIDYYVRCGFTFLGVINPQNTTGLPAHYKGISLSLFEIEVLLNKEQF